MRVTNVPELNEAWQVAPQEIPEGFEVTVPTPEVETDRVNVCTVNVAVTVEPVETEQLPVPVHAPDQPVNEEPAPGDAVRVTRVPEVKEAEQVAPQEIPAGDEVTVPVPEPALETEKLKRF